MITPAQLRAARGLLDWTRSDLAKAAGVSPETIKNIEHGTFRPQEGTAEAIVKAFRANDVEFMDNEGVRRHKALVKTYVGSAGYQAFCEEVAAHVEKNNGGMTRHFNFSDRTIIQYLPDDYIARYAERMGRIKNLDSKCLIPYGDTVTPFKYCEYRQLDQVYDNTLPFYLCDDTVFLVTKLDPKEVVSVSILSTHLATALRKQFDYFWNRAKAIRDAA